MSGRQSSSESAGIEYILPSAKSLSTSCSCTIRSEREIIYSNSYLSAIIREGRIHW